MENSGHNTDKSFEAVHYPPNLLYADNQVTFSNSEEKLHGASQKISRISSLYGMKILVSRTD